MGICASRFPQYLYEYFTEESGFDTEGFAVDDLPFEQPHTQTVFYRVVATPKELEQVEMAFNSIGIFFERRNENE